jgi:hypothetical protein
MMARINIAPHAFLYQKAKFGNELKENIISCVYTSIR